MPETSRPWFKIATGKDFQALTRRPTAKEVVDRRLQQLQSAYPLRRLGDASDGQIFLSEEARESHIHILGAPGEGKSKFIEMLVRQDVERGYGACVLDPSDNGDTCYKILKFCAKRGFDKVVLIDPHDAHAFGKVISINPLHYKALPSVSAGNIQDTIRVLWGSRAEETPKINKYLPAILKALHASEMTLYEALYFTDQSHFAYKSKREAILEKLHPLDRDRVALESAFSSSKQMFSNEMDSTARRVNPFFDDVMRLIVGSNASPLNFQKMISEGWLILVNLDPTGVWGSEQQRLLGTLIINELMYAVFRLQEHGWKGTYYVYIDEVGDYATPKLANLLDKKRKTGMRFTLAHQRFDQIEDKNVLSSVKGSTKIKVLFNTPNRDDRDTMLRMMYGGDVPDRQVSYELGQLKKQHAAIKINKQPPRITRLPDVKDVDIASAELKAFKEKLYTQPWYRSPLEVLNEINDRFKEAEQPVLSRVRAAEPPPATKVKPPSRPKPEGPSPTRSRQRAGTGKDSGSSAVGALFGDQPDSSSFLLRRKGRATSKILQDPPKKDE